MSDYRRTTRECTLETLPPELAAALRAHVERYELGAILSTAVACVETTSEKKKKGWFGGREATTLGAVLTADWLLFATVGTKAPVAVLSARLSQITARDYASSELARLAPDFGLEVQGTFTDVSEGGSAFLGLEDNATGRAFRDAVLAAVRRHLGA